jgi:hypothetical protein
MKVITPGHLYELASFEGGPAQRLQFIEKKASNPNASVFTGASPFVTVNDGTTNEEVIEMVIDRINFLQGKVGCRENAIAVTHLETALLWLNKRTQDRVKRGVEGTPSK